MVNTAGLLTGKEEGEGKGDWLLFSLVTESAASGMSYKIKKSKVIRNVYLYHRSL
jgi:hypothetical protein